MTNYREFGKVVSVNGPDKCPIIVLIHRDDTGKDDTAMFDWYGLRGGYDRTYTIKED